MNKNISHIKNCFGCGVCVIACKRQIIKLKLSRTGFYQPYIVTPDQCTNCGLCLKVCSKYNRGLSLVSDKIHPFVGWSNNHIVRYNCSSGGVTYEISKYLLQQGYKICACRYNASRVRAEHFLVSNNEELVDSIGSKYLQSYTVDALLQLNKKQKYLFIGTPCQVDSVRRLVKLYKCESNFVFVDFFCHGVPSYKLWYKYLNQYMPNGHTFASWRNKTHGWQDSWCMVIDDKMSQIDLYNLKNKIEFAHYFSFRSKNDSFFWMFLSNLCLNKSCYSDCKYKYNNSSADIRVGDCWGKTYEGEKDGVNAILAMTEIGNNLLQKIDCKLIQQPIGVVSEGQIKQIIKRPWLYSIAMILLSIPLFKISQIHSLLFKINILSSRIKKFFQ